MTSADIALFPTFVSKQRSNLQHTMHRTSGRVINVCTVPQLQIFITYICPRKFGWESAFEGRPKLAKWFEWICSDPVASKIKEEVEGGLIAWDENER